MAHFRAAEWSKNNGNQNPNVKPSRRHPRDAKLNNGNNLIGKGEKKNGI